MDSKTIESMLEQKKYEELMELLNEEDYEEYSMLTQCRILMYLNQEKEAKKVARKMKMLFPSGEFMQETELIIKALSENTTEEYLHKLSWCAPKSEKEGISKPEESCAATEKIQDDSMPDSLTKLFMDRGKTSPKEREIPKTIAAYFENVIGMENVQAELNKFYKLLKFQSERSENEFTSELVKSYNFAVSGQRGCGKTLVGEIIAKMLYDFGVRDNNKHVSVETRDLLLAWKSDVMGGISRLLSQAGDATIIIENLQECFTGEENVSIKPFLRQLEKSLKEKKNNCSVVLTGTAETMRRAMSYNETLIDVFYELIEIPQYSTIELYEIAKILAKQKSMLIHEDAQKALMKKIDMERKNPNFMNAITLKRFIEQASVKMAERFYDNATTSEAAMVYLRREDFEVEYEEKNLEELLNQLDSLTGLDSVKKQVRTRIESVIAEEKATNAGAQRKGGKGSLHLLFTGNPGTGKTMVARLLGEIYQQLGVLPRGNNVVEVTRSGLVGQYQGHTAKLVQERVKEAMGGILFIDEAYSLCRDNLDTFGHEAVDELIAQIENNKDNFMVIFAGYKKEMADFLKTNPGLSSRVRNFIEFEDYSAEEMTEIFKYMVKSRQMQLAPDTEQPLKQMIEEKSRRPDFGNARGVRNLFDEVMEAQNTRIIRLLSTGANVDKNQYDILALEDIIEVAERKSEAEKSLEELLEDLNNLVGLSSVKEKVQEMVADMQVKEYMKRQSIGISDNSDHGTLHLVFKGNAGTGKTTVARLIGRIYNKLGILKKNVFVETGRKDLVASYSGQTAGRVIKKIEEADGGILFIDEAYALDNGERDEFGHEAITTLVAELENRRNTLMVIIAGYAEEMNRFLDFNQGLKSRLSSEIMFEDFNDEELVQIFKKMVEQKRMQLPEDGDIDDIIKKMICEAQSKEKDFGNARGVRNMVERIERKKNLRIAKLLCSEGEISEREINKVTVEDIV